MTTDKEEFWVKLAYSTDLIEFATTPARAYILISQIQLALRHPQNKGAAAEAARDLALNLTEAVCHFIPDARESLEQGWNPSCDVNQDYFDAEFH